MPLIIHFENHICSCKDQCIRLLASLSILKIKLHNHIFENRDISHHDSFILLILIIFNVGNSRLSPENKKLVLNLFVHDQIFARDNCKPVIVVRFCDPYYLIWLSRFCGHQFYRNFSTDLEGLRINHQNFIDLSYQKYI